MSENIDQAILEVYNKVGYVQKQGRMQGGGANYTFAGERDFIEVIRPAMVEAGITMRLAELTHRERGTYVTAKGSPMNTTYIEGIVRFTHAPSGTHIDCMAAGEGSDSGDKSSPKSLTGLIKYALRQTFLIETGDDPDNHSSDEMTRGAPQGKNPTEKAPQDPTTAFLERARNTVAGFKVKFKDIPELKIRPEAQSAEIKQAVLGWYTSLGKTEDEAIDRLAALAQEAKNATKND